MQNSALLATHVPKLLCQDWTAARLGCSRLSRALLLLDHDSLQVGCSVGSGNTRVFGFRHRHTKIGEGRQVTLLSPREELLRCWRSAVHPITEKRLLKDLQHGLSGSEARKAIRCVDGLVVDGCVTILALRSEDGVRNVVLQTGIGRNSDQSRRRV